MNISKQKRSIYSVTRVGILSGIASIIFVYPLYYVIGDLSYNAITWIVGWSITNLSTIDKEELIDDESYKKLSKKTGILCAGIVLIAILIAMLPTIVDFDLEAILTNFVVIVECVIGVYWGYSKGVEVIANAYYDSVD